ncbi:HD domain-containing protein [Myxococcota bacterium]|nr:HD domain-containing protein [Myxococcota bacterium]
MMRAPFRPLPARILVVDADAVLRELLSDFLRLEGHQVLIAADAMDALGILESERVDLLLGDLLPLQNDAVALPQVLAARFSEIVGVVMAPFKQARAAIQLTRQGFFDYVLKPFKIEDVVHTVTRGLEDRALRSENVALKGALSLYQLADQLTGEVDLTTTLHLFTSVVLEQTAAWRVSLLLSPQEGIDWPSAALCAAGEADEAGPLSFEDLKPAALALEEAILAVDGRAFELLEVTPRTEPITSLLISPLTARGERLGVLVAARRGVQPFGEGDRKLLKIVADRVGVTAQNAQLIERLERSFQHTIEVLITALEEKDRYTAGHSNRVAEYARWIAEELGLPPREVELIHRSGRLHDIGKLLIRSEDLNKPSALTREELARFRKHPEYGEQLLKPIPTFREVIPGVAEHHESFDGTGYPRGLAGEEISLMARIMAVADAYDAMTSRRAYREARPHAYAMRELREGSGGQFDPRCVEAFVKATARRPRFGPG